VSLNRKHEYLGNNKSTYSTGEGNPPADDLLTCLCRPEGGMGGGERERIRNG